MSGETQFWVAVIVSVVGTLIAASLAYWTPNRKLKMALVIACPVIVLLGGIWIDNARDKWNKETATVTGTVSGNVLTKSKEYKIKVGGGFYVVDAKELEKGINLNNYMKAFADKFSFDVPIKIIVKDNRILLDTYIKVPEQSQPLFEIINNEFTYNPNKKYDKNYTRNAIEIVDENLLPMLQIYMKDDNLIYIGGSVKKKTQTVYFTQKESTIRLNSNKEIPESVKRLFKYPSSDYPSALEYSNLPF